MHETAAVGGRRRDSALLRTLRTGAGVQATVVLSSILSLPFVTRALDPAEYGVLVTLTGIMPLLAFADLGAGAALTQKLSRAVAAGDPEKPREIVATAAVVMAGAAVLVAVVGATLSFLLPWQEILGAPEIPPATLTLCTLTASLTIAAFLLGGLGQAALFGLQRGATANRWLMVSAVGTSAASIAASVLSAPLWVFVLTTVGVPALSALSCTLWVVLLTRNPHLRPRRRRVPAADLLHFSGTSGWFLLIAVSAALGFQTDTVVVATVLGAASAGTMSVALRVFGLVSACLYPVLLQTWPAFSEASVTGDHAWIRSRFRVTTLAALLGSSVACLVLVLVGNQVIAVFLTEELTSPPLLLVSLALWTTYSLSTSPMFFLMNALGRVRTHALMAASVAVVNIPLSILLAQRIGIAGPILASLFASLLLQGIPGAFVVRKLLAGLSTTTETPEPADKREDQSQ